MFRSSTLTMLLSTSALWLAANSAAHAAGTATGVIIGTPRIVTGTADAAGTRAGAPASGAAAVRPPDALDGQDLSERDRRALRQELQLTVGADIVDQTALKAAVTNEPADWPAGAQGVPVNAWTGSLGNGEVALQPAGQPGGGFGYGDPGASLEALPAP